MAGIISFAELQHRGMAELLVFIRGKQSLKDSPSWRSLVQMLVIIGCCGMIQREVNACICKLLTIIIVKFCLIHYSPIFQPEKRNGSHTRSNPTSNMKQPWHQFGDHLPNASVGDLLDNPNYNYRVVSHPLEGAGGH